MVFFRYFYIEGGKSGYTQQAGVNQLFLNEIELYDASNNNVARNAGVVATSKSYFNSDKVPSTAIDGNIFNSFESAVPNNSSTDYEWLQIDLGQPYDIRKVRIYNEYGDTWYNQNYQHKLSKALMIGYNDVAARTDTSKRLWVEFFDTIAYYSNTTSPRYWDYTASSRLLLALGTGSHNISFSNDGLKWRGLGNSIFSNNGNQAAHNGTMWVATGSGTNTLAYSYDGITWTGLGNIIFNEGVGIATNGTRWVASGSPAGTSIPARDNTLAYSNDGINWTGLGKSVFTGYGGTIKWNGTMWVIVGWEPNFAGYSYDGITWTGLGRTVPGTPFTREGYDVVSDGTTWYAAGFGTNSLAYTTNSNITNWTGLGETIFSSCSGIDYNGSMWVAVGSGTNTVAYSTNGTTWTGLGKPIFSTGQGYKVRWTGTMWIALGQGGNPAAYSYNGTSWTTFSSDELPASNSYRAIVWGEKVSQVSPTITFSIPAKTFGTDISFNLVPSSNSNGAFTFTSSNTSVATISGSTVTILGAGSSTITATQASTSNYLSGSATATLTVAQASPTISFSVPPKTFGDASFSLVPSSNSNGAFTFTSSNTAVATVSGSSVTIIGAGSSTITATQDASGNYLSGSTTANLTVNQLAPTISFNDIVKTMGNQPFNLAPISNSNGAFTFTSSNTSVATVSTSTITTVNGTPTFSNVNNNYLSIDIPSNPTMALAISPDGNTMIIPNHYNSNLHFTKYNGTSWSAFVTVNYTSIGNARDCCLTADGLRLIVINGSDASDVGVGRCYFFTWNGTTFDSPTQTLDTTSRNYLGVDVTADGSRIVATADGTVYFATWNGTNYTAFTATSETIYGRYGIGITRDGSKIAYSNGGNRIYYASWNGTTYTGITQISGSVSTGRKVRFSYDGNIIFNSLYGNSTGSIQYSLWNGSEFSSFAMVPSSAMPGSLDLWGFAVDANNLIYATSFGSRNVYKTNITNTISSSESKLTIVGAGSSTITANQAASTNYLSGTATATLTVNKIVTVLNGVTNMIKSYGDVFTLNYASNSNGALSYVISDPSIASIFGSTVTATKVGSTTITVTQAETENYLQETLSFVLTVNKAEPSLSNFSILTKTFGDASFNIVAPTSLSSGAFTYLSSNNSVATVSGSTITIVGAGTSTIIATQETTDEYLSGSITCLLTVNKASPMLSNFNNIVKTYGDPSFNIVQPTSLSSGAFTYSSSNTSKALVFEDIITIVTTGTLSIIATQEETNNYLSETINCVLTVNKIETTLSIFDDILKTYGDSDFTLLEPQSDRLGTYTYLSSDSSVATIVDNIVTITGGGIATITAIQDETEFYKPGLITCILKVNQINSTLNYIDVLLIDGSYKIIVDTNSDGLFSYSVSDSRIVTINSDNTLSFLQPGDITVVATQAETATYYSGEFSTVVSYTGA